MTDTMGKANRSIPPSMTGRSVRKQQSESFSGVRRRPTTEASQGPRPTSEFGWQLALQAESLGARSRKETILEEEPQDGAAKSWNPFDSHVVATPPPSYTSIPSKPPPSQKAPESPASPSSATKELEKLSKRYADKDIGWQLGLQCQNIPHILRAQAERSPIQEESTNPYAGADVGPKESPPSSPRPPASANSQDSFQQLNLDEAAKFFRSFSTEDNAAASASTSPSPPPRPPEPTPPTPASSKDFFNNPFHAFRLQAAAEAQSNSLIDLDDDRPLPAPPPPQRSIPLPPLPQRSAPLPPPPHRSAPLPPSPPRSAPQPPPTWSNLPRPTSPEEALVECGYCPQRVSVTEISQIPECLHAVCHACLVTHIESELSACHFPIMCPMCSLQLEDSEPGKIWGMISDGIINQIGLPQASHDIYEEYRVSASSSSIYCPKCKETMLVDREQYLEESIITCPLSHCGHRWCKSCSKDMPHSGNAHKHKCAPDKKAGARSCPGCGYQGRRIANDNYIQCRGVGCQLHFCFKCGQKIADGSNTSNVTSQVEEHYRTCTRHSKGDKCKVQ